jgi:hypothetical protein
LSSPWFFLLFCFVFLPGLVLEPCTTCLPHPQRSALTTGHPCPGRLNRLQCDTCAVCWVGQDRGVGAGALGLINIKSFMTVLSSL